MNESLHSIREQKKEMCPQKSAPKIQTTLPPPKEDPIRLRLIQELNQALSSGDSSACVLAVGRLARDHGLTDIAGGTGLNRAQLYRSLGEDGNPAFASILKVLDVMGLKISVVPKY